VSTQFQLPLLHSLPYELSLKHVQSGSIDNFCSVPNNHCEGYSIKFASPCLQMIRVVKFNPQLKTLETQPMVLFHCILQAFSVFNFITFPVAFADTTNYNSTGQGCVDPKRFLACYQTQINKASSYSGLCNSTDATGTAALKQCELGCDGLWHAGNIACWIQSCWNQVSGHPSLWSAPMVSRCPLVNSGVQESNISRIWASPRILISRFICRLQIFLLAFAVNSCPE